MTDITPVSPHNEIEVNRVRTETTLQYENAINPRSAFHVYPEGEHHKFISPVIDPGRERWCGPSQKEQKVKRLQKQERKKSGLPPVEPDDTAFFLHQPYLSFHAPPRVLYTGSSKYTANPVVLIHDGCFWRDYKLQLGQSISQPGVIDPRGVVSWRHNGGDKKALKDDEHKLKGYKVRGWRLWGETGKKYVHTVRANRKAGKGTDPDVLEVKGLESEKPAVAEEVIHLRWISPLSRHTRCYHFHYLGIDFYWKGTASVRESRACGLFLRFNHLKLVARLPIVNGKRYGQDELCLGKYTCSIAARKSGTLEFFDETILRLVDAHAPSMLDSSSDEGQLEENMRNERVLKLRKSTLYQVFMATATCMIRNEKEKRHTLLELLIVAAEGGG
ncbi:hypothetical protein COCMIDRAFT_85488 [Bipolaris oryzae ATCC 44560]|uniref:Uncharacterized protein n=1 Tax=Bipolaris oryzae ATCC 44560 TaxID=930090 RepID=W6ZBE4_COCMI|nr:uncharacterized protein COCMIDRAFT_85488 [Bipolaris oryzae ATCC 44560]EUC49122.1 hypothetical protein COCMIDRAFT_85488 [Bipolaris oryzae ATCC 44560]